MYKFKVSTNYHVEESLFVQDNITRARVVELMHFMRKISEWNTRDDFFINIVHQSETGAFTIYTYLLRAGEEMHLISPTYYK